MSPTPAAMDGLSRSEYPGMLTSLHPSLAVFALQERVKRIGKINQEIADWLQERRKVEEAYVGGLRKLLLIKAPNSASELGVFQPAWESILNAVDALALSHHQFSAHLEKDVELPLRAFQNKKEMTNMATISGNLTGMAKELEEAQDRADKLSKKGGKASTQKMDAATIKLEGAHQQWESQAPFVFENLQALDELRTNHLRDLLTQLETLEVDQATQNQATAEALLNVILEIKTEDEIQGFAQRVTAGRPKLEKRPTGRQPSVAESSRGSQHGGSLSSPSPAHAAQPPVPPVPAQHQTHPSHPSLPFQHHSAARSDDNTSEHSGRNDAPAESKLRSRIGTMLGRRRQSVHGGFGPLSPPKSSSAFGGRPPPSSHGRAISPRSSSNNLAENQSQRLSSLAETPDSPVPPSTADSRGTLNGAVHANTNGTSAHTNGGGAAHTNGAAAAHSTNHDDVFAPPPGPPPSRKTAEPAKDADGFTIPARPTDPISQAQREASGMAPLGEEAGAEPAFKVSIQNEPVADEDAAAKKAAMSNVANTLSMAMPTPSRKAGTVRGRRDVRNTIYVPSPAVGGSGSSPALPHSPTLPSLPSSATSVTGARAAAMAALTSEHSGSVAASDTQSIRSATSLGGLAHLKHAEMAGPGLHASIIETVSASFVDGALQLSKVAGEIAFAYEAEGGAGEAPESETIRVDNVQLLEAIGPNRIFVQNTAANDTFTLATAHLQAHRPTVAFTFRAFGDSPTALSSQCPLAVQATWKPVGDRLGLVLQYRRHEGAAGAAPLRLHNLVLVATYEGARASGVQTKPTGVHVKDKHLVYWRVGDVSLTDTWAKIVCRVVGQQGAEPQPGHIEARWEAASVETFGGLAIGISRAVGGGGGGGSGKGKEPEEEADPFADETSKAEEGWVEVPAVRQVVSGRYEAK